MDILIIGAGGFGREVLDTLNFINQSKSSYNILGFIDNAVPKGSQINEIEVLGDDGEIQNYPDAGLVIAIGSPHVRQIYFERYFNSHTFPIIIHPTALVSNFSEIGDGTIIQAFCIVASNAKIGYGVSINARSGVGHDVKVGNYCSIQSFCDITGNNNVGELCYLGTGVKIIPNLKIASGSYLCAGTVVFKDISVASKVLGNPGKIII